MAYDPSKYTTGPSEQELRMRAAHRVARRRSFTTSLVVVGSLIVLNLFFYAQSHNATWLMLDAVFACTLAYRAWVAFGSDHKDDACIQQEVARMRPSAAPTPCRSNRLRPFHHLLPAPTLPTGTCDGVIQARPPDGAAMVSGWRGARRRSRSPAAR